MIIKKTVYSRQTESWKAGFNEMKNRMPFMPVDLNKVGRKSKAYYDYKAGYEYAAQTTAL